MWTSATRQSVQANCPVDSLVADNNAADGGFHHTNTNFAPTSAFLWNLHLYYSFNEKKYTKFTLVRHVGVNIGQFFPDNVAQV